MPFNFDTAVDVPGAMLHAYWGEYVTCRVDAFVEALHVWMYEPKESLCQDLVR